MELNGNKMDTTRKEMLLELLRERLEWNKRAVTEDRDDIVSVHDNSGIVTRALLDSVRPVAEAFGDGYYVACREVGAVINIVLK